MWGAQARKTPEQLCWDPAGTPMGHMPLGSPGVQHRQLTDFGNTAHLSWNHEGASGFFPQRGAGPGGDCGGVSLLPSSCTLHVFT